MSDSITWPGNDTGRLAGRTAVVTGAGGGIGLETARRLAGKGAHVVLACRDLARGREAAQQITGTAGRASVTAQALDLADLASVREFADRVVRDHGGIDILVNNAGIAGGPRRSTADGFEAHFGTNHLGHFALTGLLLPALLARPGARVVTVTSSVAAQGRIDFTDLGSERRYRFIAAYSRSKLANLMFAVELDRRAKAAGVTLVSTAANPGIVTTSLLSRKRGQWGRGSRPAELAVAAIQRLYGQPPGDGCRTSLYAATAPGLRGGEYIVPGGRGHMRGAPVAAPPPPRALDQETVRQLWETSAGLTGVSFTALAAGTARADPASTSLRHWPDQSSDRPMSTGNVTDSVPRPPAYVEPQHVITSRGRNGEEQADERDIVHTARSGTATAGGARDHAAAGGRAGEGGP